MESRLKKIVYENPLKTGGCQGDTIFPIMCSVSLERSFMKVDWKDEYVCSVTSPL